MTCQLQVPFLGIFWGASLAPVVLPGVNKLKNQVLENRQVLSNLGLQTEVLLVPPQGLFVPKYLLLMDTTVLVRFPLTL